MEWVYILKFSVRLRSLHFVSPSEKYVSTSCKGKQSVSFRWNVAKILFEIQMGIVCLRSWWWWCAEFPNLGVGSSPVNPMNDIDVDVCKSFGKSEKLSGREHKERTLKRNPIFAKQPNTPRKRTLKIIVPSLILTIRLIPIWVTF